MKKQLLTIFILLFTLAPATWADESFWSWAGDFSRKKGVAPVADETYLNECGACHFPYQPGLLPEASWKKLFDPKQMADHFGDNIELDEAMRQQLLKLASENSADKSYYKRSRKIMSSFKDGAAPMRITETPYIIKKHDEIPDRLIRQNKEVKSLSNCDNCHKKADKGIYDDDSVSIPGHGRWED